MNGENLTQAKQQIQQAVDNRDKQLREIAQKIHANPELLFQEYKAVRYLTEPLKESGFNVETGIADLETAFSASWVENSSGPTIAILAEYDALPEVGHACGHNLIGTAAIGAALALKDVFPELPGKILVLGTPAEEGGGGKVIMSEKGIFDHVDAAMMFHPLGRTMVLQGGLGCTHVTFKFYGKESHASAYPEKGVSALDALLSSFAAINSLRQFTKDDVRIHGIITKGGDAPNIVPSYCEAQFLIRASTMEELEDVKEKIYKAVRHSSIAVGAECEIIESISYKPRKINKSLANLFKNNLSLMGIEVNDYTQKEGLGSSDIGDVSHITPVIHPYIKICSDEIKPHTPEFSEATKSEEGMIGLNQAAKALAMTAYELCINPDRLSQVRDEFEKWRGGHKVLN